MNYSKKIPDLSNEMIIQRFGSGIRLVRPEKRIEKPLHCISDMLGMPFNVYFLNQESVLQKLNSHTAESCGFISPKDAVGRTVREVSDKTTADHLIRNDREVIDSANMKISDDNFTGLEDFNHTAVSIKFPWYNLDNKIVGVFGCSIVLNSPAIYSLSHSLSLLTQVGLLAPSTCSNNELFILGGMNFENYYLTKREKEILRLIILGKSARLIAQQLNISHRTVETHIENMKFKTFTSSKAELIEKSLSQFKPI